MDNKRLAKAKRLASRGYQFQLIRETEQDGASYFVAYVPEMPNCIATGDTPEEAKKNLRTAREDYIYFRLKRGVSVPQPEYVSLSGATLKLGSPPTTHYDTSPRPPGAVGRVIRSDGNSNGYFHSPAAATVGSGVKWPIT